MSELGITKYVCLCVCVATKHLNKTLDIRSWVQNLGLVS